MAVSGRAMVIGTCLFALVLYLFQPFGMLIAPVPVAFFSARGERSQCLGMFAVCSVIGYLAAGVVGLMVYPMWGVTGLLIGMGMAGGWKYSTIIVVATALAFVIEGLLLAGQWQTIKEVIEDMYTKTGAMIDDPDEAGVPRAQLPVLKLQQWMLAHWASFAWGVVFSTVLITACVVTSVTGGLLRRLGGPRHASAFALMRPPDWLAWVVIAVAAAWFAEGRLSFGVSQLVTWNAAIALACVYFLNGAGVLVYAVAAFRPHALIVGLLVMVMMLGYGGSALPVVGLFDTWGNFRRKIDKILAERKRREDTEDDSS